MKLKFSVFFVFVCLTVDVSTFFGQEQQQATVTVAEESFFENGEDVHLLEFGFHNNGYNEHIFQQFTGDDVYEQAETPNYLTWFGYHFAYPLDIPFISGISFGGEYHNITLEPSTPGKSLKNKPRPNMNANLFVLSTRIYFGELKKVVNPNTDYSMFNFFYGLGWGYLSGKFTGEYAAFSPKQFETGFSGLYTHREVGIVLQSESWGIGVSVQFVRAPLIKVDDDLFNQKSANDDYLNLDFGGVSNAFFVRWKF